MGVSGVTSSWAVYQRLLADSPEQDAPFESKMGWGCFLPVGAAPGWGPTPQKTSRTERPASARYFPREIRDQPGPTGNRVALCPLFPGENPFQPSVRVPSPATEFREPETRPAGGL